MNIQVLGPGCPRCETLAENAAAALKEMGVDAEVEKVTGLGEMAAMGVFTTPALAVEGRVLASGRLLSPRQIRALLEENGVGT